MNARFRHELPRPVAACVDAADAAPPPEAVDAAQQRLRARLERATPARRIARSRAPWLAAATAAVLAIVVIGTPLLTQQSNAFARVQAHLRDFRTLSMQVEQRYRGRVVQDSHMVVDARGVVRTDVGKDLSVIVDPVRGRLLILQHDAREAVLMPLEQAPKDPAAALDWIAEIRDFQGQAQPLKQTRTIDGRVAHGWALDVAGQRLVLWADNTGLPLAMEGGGGNGLEIRYRFAFDVPLAAGYLSSDVPAGYTVERADAD